MCIKLKEISAETHMVIGMLRKDVRDKNTRRLEYIKHMLETSILANFGYAELAISNARDYYHNLIDKHKQ